MRFLVVSLLLVLLTACVAKNTLPTPTNLQVGGFEGAATYGIAVHVMNQYLYSPDCTSPITALPCSKSAIRASLRSADNNAYDAMLKAVAAIRQAPNTAPTTTAITDANTKIKALDDLTKSDDVQSTLKKGN